MEYNRVDRIISFIRKTIYGAGMKNAIVGISGGIDSAVVAALCVNAVGFNHVYGIMLPYDKQHDIEDSISVVEKLKIKHETIDIFPQVQAFCGHGGDDEEGMSTLRYGDIKARVRMIWLYDRAKRHNGLVIGTGNRSELLMGYFTLHGDGACDLEPIGHLYKTEVRELAKMLDIPQPIIDKAPSAGLWPNQTDEEEMGISYSDMDNIFMRAEGMKWKTSLPKILERDE